MGNLLYKRFNLLAKKLIKKYGYNKIRLIRQIKTGHSWENNFEEETVYTDCLIVPSSKYSKENYRLNSGKDIVENNYIGFIPHTDFIPTINDRLVTDNGEFTIVSVTNINPDGSQQILYKLELK